ncbi:MAG TPA: hypothetical protein VHO90_00755 [Bacteroidales bacterium]|nr:hypothetical protein [Bacteroidales bacterium]
MKSIVETIEKAKSFQILIGMLQKNNNLNYLAQVRKSLDKLSKNQEDLDVLIGIYNKDVSKIFKEKDGQRQTLKQHLLKVAGLLQLYDKNTKKGKDKNKYDPLTDNFDDISDKKVLKLAQKTLLKANKIGGYSIASINTASPQKISKKIKKAQEINTDLGLTSEMVKQLELEGTEFMLHLIRIDAIISEKVKTMKQIKKNIYSKRKGIHKYNR